MSAPAARRAAAHRPGAAESSAAAVRSLTPGSRRTARYRERLRSGSVVVSVSLPLAVIELLIDTHWLSESEAEDRRQIGAALAAMLTDAAKAHRR